MLYNVTQIKKDIHWLMEQVKCLMKNQDSSPSTISQNNVFRSISLSTTEDVSETVVANYINGLPSFTIEEIELLTITVTKITEEHSVTYKYLLINTGKGTYGQTGFLIDSSNLLLIYEKELVSGDVEDLDTTQVITFGLVDIDVSTTLNNYTPPLLIQNQADGYVLFKTSEGNYLFLGEGGLYGDGELQTTMADFQLLAEDILPITNTSQLINDGATGVSTYTEQTYVDALIVAEALARNNADNALITLLANKEDKLNKTGILTGNTASTTLYMHIAGLVANFQQILTDITFGSFLNSLPSKPAPINADSVSLLNSIDGKANKVSLTDFKAFLKTYFDTQYASETFNQSRWQFSDFTNVSANQGPYIGVALASGTLGGSGVTSLSDVNSLGHVILNSSASANSGYRLLDAGGVAMCPKSGITFLGKFGLDSNAASRDRVTRIGFHSTQNQAAPLNGVYLEVLGNTASFKATSGGVTTSSSTVTLDDTFTGSSVILYSVFITFTADRVARCVLYNSAMTALLTITFTTADNMPVLNSRFNSGIITTITTAGAITNICQVDYMGVGIAKPSFLNNY